MLCFFFGGFYARKVRSFKIYSKIDYILHDIWGEGVGRESRFTNWHAVFVFSIDLPSAIGIPDRGEYLGCVCWFSRSVTKWNTAVLAPASISPSSHARSISMDIKLEHLETGDLRPWP